MMKTYLLIFFLPFILQAQEILPSWNEGPLKQSIIQFIQKTTDPSSVDFVPVEDRIVVFDQDGTLWVEHPIYSQVIYSLDRIPEIAKDKPEIKDKEPFKTVLSGNKEAIMRLSDKDLMAIAAVTLTGMTTEQFALDVQKWLANARDPRWNHPYTELTYLPMQELMAHFRKNGFKTYVVTGGGQDFVREYAGEVYQIPPEQVVGTSAEVEFSYNKDGKPVLMKLPKILLNDNYGGKPEGIHLMIGKRPIAAFGNSTGDQQMLEYVKGGSGLRLAMLVLHDDAVREYAYGPAEGLPDTKIGTFTQALFDKAKESDWGVISMKNDWKQIFSF
jgi:phosphoglycolate phosphatase-like HAD superfamily hydrolase